MSAQASDNGYPFPEMHTAGSMSLRETRDLVLRDRAWRETGQVMSAEDARAWYQAKRARQDIQSAAG